MPMSAMARLMTLDFTTFVSFQGSLGLGETARRIKALEVAKLTIVGRLCFARVHVIFNGCS